MCFPCSISRKEIIQRCRNKPHDMLCAGEALALMDLMQTFHLTIKGMHELSGVARSMIHDLLTMDAVTTNDRLGKLGRPFGMEAIEFHLLGFRLWDTEPMQATKHAVLTVPNLAGARTPPLLGVLEVLSVNSDSELACRNFGGLNSDSELACRSLWGAISDSELTHPSARTAAPKIDFESFNRFTLNAHSLARPAPYAAVQLG